MAKDTSKRTTGDVAGSEEFEDLNSNYEISGFVVRPTDKDRTPRDFVGVLRKVIESEDRDETGDWGIFEVVDDQPNVVVQQRDDEGDTTEIPCQAGMFVGVTISGALQALKKKVNHKAIIHWPGTQKSITKGKKTFKMWEASCKVSVKPVPVS